MHTPRWRVGRSLGRTLYRQTGSEPSKADEFVGVMDTRELADLVVAALNAYDVHEAQRQAAPFVTPWDRPPPPAA
jgi:hypothetical protein